MWETAIRTGWKTIQGQYNYMGTHSARNCLTNTLEDNAGLAQLHGNTQCGKLPYKQAGRQCRVSTVTWEHTVWETAIRTGWKTIQGQHSYMGTHSVGTAICTGWKIVARGVVLSDLLKIAYCESACF